MRKACSGALQGCNRARAQLLFRGADAVVQNLFGGAVYSQKTEDLPASNCSRLSFPRARSTGARLRRPRDQMQLFCTPAFDLLQDCLSERFMRKACSGAFQGCVRTRAELLLRGADAAVQNLLSCSRLSFPRARSTSTRSSRPKD